MTLKEKFKEILTAFWINDWENECEQVADDFAIGFGEWLVSNAYSENDMYWWLIKTNGDVRKSTKELLEIYKKENEL